MGDSNLLLTYGQQITVSLAALSKVFGSGARSPLFFIPSLLPPPPALWADRWARAHWFSSHRMHSVMSLGKAQPGSSSSLLRSLSLSRSWIICRGGTGWGGSRNRPTPLSDAPFETYLLSKVGLWVDSDFLFQVFHSTMHRCVKRESEPQPYSGLDRHPGVLGADAHSARGTCWVLGGSSAPTQGGSTLGNSCFTMSAVLVRMCSCPQETAVLTIYYFLN